jgi:hypothetical protein
MVFYCRVPAWPRAWPWWSGLGAAAHACPAEELELDNGGARVEELEKIGEKLSVNLSEIGRKQNLFCDFGLFTFFLKERLSYIQNCVSYRVLVTKIIDKIRDRHQPEITNTTTFSKAG